MKKVICPKDYYNNKGILLVAKGSSVSFDKLKELERLKELEKLYRNEDLNYSKFNLKSYFEETNNLKKRYPNLNQRTLNQASNILIDIIFNSKKQPWWIHINALSNYIDWMYSHSFDVAIIALMIGVESKYTPSVLKELGLGAMLHDIGKLLIPKELLQKKTSLTNKEKSLLRRHCELGKDSVAGCSLSQISTNIILQHHERLNRSGYPNHLNALEITEYAKIVMVADSFDVLTAGRPYKKTKDSLEAISYLKKKNSGFDLHYVELLESILN